MSRSNLTTAILCGLIFALVFVLMKPFVDSPFGDDFSYVMTVKRLLETGHVVYNGWSAPMIITQAYWGAAWCKMLGGFSFINLRLSVFPLAVGCVTLFCLTARRAGLEQGPSLFATILFAFSPIFLPLAMSFMTDIPALFCTLLSLYALSRSGPSGSGILWLATATIVGIIGGMSRQTVWITPLAIIPYLVWWRRHEPKFIIAGTAAWLLTVVDIMATSRWFSRQPDVILNTSLISTFNAMLKSPLEVFHLWIIPSIMTIVVLILPAALGLIVLLSLKLWRCRNHAETLWAILVTAVGIALELHFNPSIGFCPWLRNMNNPDGLINSIQIELSGTNPFELPPIIVASLCAVSIAAIALIAAEILSNLAEPMKFAKSLHVFFRAESGNPTLPILALFAVSYCLLLATRAAAGNVFDRYLLPVVACAVIAALRVCQQLKNAGRVFRITQSISIIFLLAYTAFGLASMQQLIAVQRTRNQAVALLELRGVPPTAIAAGLCWDCWTELNTAWLNHDYIGNPTHPYSPNQGMLFALKCRYRVEFSPSYDTHPSEFPPIDYQTWLPPFHRQIQIDEFTYPWWLNPSANKNHPAFRKYWEDIVIE